MPIPPRVRSFRCFSDVWHLVTSAANFFPTLLALVALLYLSSCSFPRIIILKDPLTPEEHLNLGVAYEKQGDFEPAIKEYKAAAKKLPLAYLYLGNVHFQKKELGKAEGYYKKAIINDPRNADAHNNLAWLYYTKKENLDQAENLALKAIELNPVKENIYRDTLEKIREMKRNLPSHGRLGGDALPPDIRF
jgi:tetratricopeptide (TPR) repeat protein